MRTHFIFALALLVTACGLETEPNPDYQSATGGSGGSGSGGQGGSGGSDAGDAGGEGGTTGGSGGTSGTTGGSSGTGGDSATTDCDDNDECSAMRPQCSPQGNCVSCTSNAACDERDPLSHCDARPGSDTRGQCLACLEDEHCKDNDDGEYCLSGQCVPCQTDTDCTDLDKPECGNDGQCTGCTSDQACNGRDGAEACITTPGPNRGKCVACVGDDHCTNTDAPQCKSDNTCGACTSDAACDGRNGTERCNLRADAESFGQCVECTGATEDGDCDGKSCKQSTGECTGVDIGDLNPCEACDADSQCGTGTKCVKQMLGEADLGYYCFYDRATQGGGCADTISGLKPYSQTLAATLSIDSIEAAQAATYCLPRTSCDALGDASTTVTPGVQTCSATEECGVSNVNDGACIARGMPAVQTCTYSCDENYECPADLPNCAGDGDKYCSLP
jgi:hypothetical protein